MKNVFKLGDDMERYKYNTTGKNNILNYIKQYNSSFTAKELFNKLKENNCDVGLTTIYRYLDELLEKSMLKKYFNDKNIAYYQYLKPCEHNNHFYLKCNNCGNLIHVDCNCIVEIQNHINKDHRFNIDNKNIIITGLCDKCGGK